MIDALIPATETLALQVDADDGSTPLIVAGVVSVLLGIAIFVAPRILNYLVAAYFLVIGVLLLIAGL